MERPMVLSNYPLRKASRIRNHPALAPGGRGGLIVTPKLTLRPSLPAPGQRLPAPVGTFSPSPPYPPSMKTKTALAATALALLASTMAVAQDSDHSWSKTYPVTGKPTLDVETSDARG
jgi:hypothetical protein